MRETSEGAVKVFGMCINKKVIAGLAVVGLGIWWLAPGAIGAALPFLLLAICPLSMLFMMKAMNMNGQQQATPVAPQHDAVPAAPATATVDSAAPLDVPPAPASAATPEHAAN